MPSAPLRSYRFTDDLIADRSPTGYRTQFGRLMGLWRLNPASGSYALVGGSMRSLPAGLIDLIGKYLASLENED